MVLGSTLYMYLLITTSWRSCANVILRAPACPSFISRVDSRCQNGINWMYMYMYVRVFGPNDAYKCTCTSTVCYLTAALKPRLRYNFTVLQFAFCNCKIYIMTVRALYSYMFCADNVDEKNAVLSYTFVHRWKRHYYGVSAPAGLTHCAAVHWRDEVVIVIEVENRCDGGLQAIVNLRFDVSRTFVAVLKACKNVMTSLSPMCSSLP